MVAALMVQGTASDAGKSLIVAGLCRALARRGLRVAPFKPQNMSNNAAVAADGGEIGRAQALQAQAAGLPSSAHMNPVLLKPQPGGGAQLVLQGRRIGTAAAARLRARPGGLLAHVLESWREVARAAELVLVEGAGAAAESNLRAGDLANMGFAAAAGLPVVLVGDIDRGGVIASLVGAHAVFDAADRARVRGFVINKFRGDPALFAAGTEEIAARTGWPALGIVPWCDGLGALPDEDGVGFAQRPARDAAAALRIAVLDLPHLANFDDLDPLDAEPGVALDVVRAGAAIPGDADLVILPGSKATLADLAFVRAQGWDIDLQAHRRRGGHVLGICAGLQMLGRRVADPLAIEGPPGAAPGLGLLELETELAAEKRLADVHGVEAATGTPVWGYEMHCGRSRGAGLERPMLRLAGRDDGAVSDDGRVMGCYLHGLFAADSFRHGFLARLGAGADSGLAWADAVEAALDRWADHLAASLPLEPLLTIAGHPGQGQRRPRPAAALFDSYLIVDWSAASSRNTGLDSIWLCLICRDGRGLKVAALENPPLRALALRRVRELLCGEAARGARVLAGFDFPNGYPRGFAARAGFGADSWRAVWDGLAGLIEDGPDNRNNRFEAAAELNRRISGADFPFWGHPHQHSYPNLPPRRSAPAEQAGLPTRRLCERHVPRAKTCWQLAYNGGVGSQALLGIPVQRALRDDPALAAATRVWPFETGLAVPAAAVQVTIAEVYPSLFAVGPRQDRDRWQVENTARVLAARDDAGLLAADLAGPPSLDAAARAVVEREEGWILGAGTYAAA